MDFEIIRVNRKNVWISDKHAITNWKQKSIFGISLKFKNNVAGIKEGIIKKY